MKQNLKRAVLLFATKSGHIEIARRGTAAHRKLIRGRWIPFASTNTKQEAEHLQIWFCKLPRVPNAMEYYIPGFPGTLEALDELGQKFEAEYLRARAAA